MTYKRYYELQKLLTAEETTHERAALPLTQWAALLKEFNELKEVLNMDIRQAELNRITYEIVQAMTGGRPDTSPDVVELKAEEIDRFIDTRAAEADRLYSRLDDPMLSPDQRQAMIERLGEISDELKRADVAQRQIARKQS